MVLTAQESWQNCLSFIKENISEQAYQTWFVPIVPIKLSGSVLNIQVPSKFFYEWLESHYIELLKTSLKRELGGDARLVYSVLMEKKYDTNKPFTSKIPSTTNIESKKEKVKKTKKIVAPPVNYGVDHKVKNPFVIPGIQKVKIESQLNPQYTFANFIEGDYNQLARTAGIAVAKRPGGTSFNPLFLYGGVGLGKTHLAHAIGVEVKGNFPEKTVLYVSTERFVQQYIDSVSKGTVNDFIHFYQMIDVLIVDDVQFLSKKKSTQNIFFQIFNHLHQTGKQLILTSDKAPVDIQDVESRLLSRFKWGLSADLQSPSIETRRSIIRAKLYKDGVELPNNVVDFIAQTVTTNVRELEGALISIIAHSSLTRKDITVDLARDTLAKFVRKEQKEISILTISKAVSNYFNIAIELIQSKTRKRDVVQARQITMYFAKKYTKLSLSAIGSEIGGRDHATVLHACKTVNNLMETNKDYRVYLDDIDLDLNSIIKD